jgi:amino acid adenylation domain-containing protein
MNKHVIDSMAEPSALHPLSYGQRALWFMQQLAPEGAAYNFVHAARILTELDIAAFRQASQELVNRHPALRTTFLVRDGEPVQRVHDHMEVYFQAEDASTWDEARLNDRLAEEVYRPFDLTRGPLVRIFLFTRSAREHIALLAMHHIVTDLWSLAIILSELGVLYTAAKAGVPAALKPPATLYSDYVRRQAAGLAGPEGERLWAYWQRQLAGELPVLDLPTDRPRPPVQTDRGAAETLRFGAELTRGLKSLAKAHRATLYMALLAAFQALLHRYTGQEDILIASPIAGRDREAASLVGYFVNPLVLRADLSGNPTFAALLDQVRRTALEAFEHSAYPFPLLVERLQPVRDPSRPPLAQVVFAWQQTTRLISSQAMTSFALGERNGGRLELGKLQFESMALEHRVVPFELMLLAAEADEELVATVEYNADLFDATTIRRLLTAFQTLLAGILADPTQRVSALPLLTEQELRQELVEWNDTQTEYPHEQCLHHWFEEVVERNPLATALICGAEQLSYQQLNERANRLAHHLIKQGIGPEAVVGLCLERSIDMVVALLGVLKAGGAFLPLDPAYPAERLAFMITDSRVSILLTQHSLREHLSAPHSRLICLDREGEVLASESLSNPPRRARPENLAYLIYTSGSTGQPKGAMLHHRGVCNLAAAQQQAFGLQASDRTLQFSSLSFDASVWEVVMALLSGGALVLASREVLASGPGLLEVLRRQAITTLTLPPSMLALLPEEPLPALQTLITAGEQCSGELVARWSPGRRYFNAYGPTETTVCASMHRCTGSDLPGPPIGRPIANFQLYVLDAHLQPVPVGVAGELYIGGAGVARGYFNRPHLTAERFIPHPFSSEAGARLYKSGDLVRYRPDGNLEYLGRLDQQVKVRGFRIELGEIEAVLAEQPGVREAVVVAREDGAGERRLVAYLVAEPGASLGLSELRHSLRERLPDYMIPSAFVSLEALPLTPNGKVDRQALPAPDRVRPELEANYVMPCNEMEQAIAAVWQQVLGLERVGVNDNFFDLGGHSLKLAKVHDQLQAIFNRDVPMVEMFKYPTVGALAEYLSQEHREGPSLQKSYQRAMKQREAMDLG